MTAVAIITAAGQGKRMGEPKQFLELDGQTILERTLGVFNSSQAIDGIILVVNQEDIEKTKSFNIPKLLKVVAGGRERQDSVRAGLAVLPKECELVAIHDGARPLVTSAIVDAAIKEATKSKAAIVAVPVKDTIRTSEKTLKRDELWAVQTPQVFKKEIILEAFEKYGKEPVTDDAMLVEKLGIPVKMVMGSYANIKITTPEDLLIAEGLLKTLETCE